MLRIRLARGGAKRRPFYRIVVAENRTPQTGRFIEKVGTYDPILADRDKRVRLKPDRIRHWLFVGARPSERVEWFLGRQGLLPMPTRRQRPKRSAPKAESGG